MPQDHKLTQFMSLRTRLFLIAGGVIFSFTLLVLGGFVGFSYLNDAGALEVKLERASARLQLVIRGLNELVITEASGTSNQYLSAKAKEARDTVANLMNEIADGEVRAEIEKSVLPQLKEADGYIEKLLKFSEGEVTSQTNEPIRMFARAVKHTEGAIVALGKLHSSVSEKAAVKVKKIVVAMVVGVALSMALVVVLFSLLYRSIVLPIYKMSDFAAKVSEGDFSAELKINRGDEIGVLARSLGQMSSNLRLTLSNLKDSSDRLAVNVSSAAGLVKASEDEVKATLAAHELDTGRGRQASRKLHELTSEVSAQCERLQNFATEAAVSVAQVSDSINKVAEKSASHSELAATTTDNVKAMLGSLSKISQSMQQLTATSEELAAAITQMQATVAEVDNRASESSKAAAAVYESATGQGLTAVRSAETGIDVIDKSMKSLSDSIARLESRSKEIGSIVDVIGDVAEQTSLLALNAAILAAQAGPHGVGFAVVADEVKSLASRTSLSTKEIAALIKNTQAETKSSVQMAELGMESVAEGVKRFREVRETLERIGALSEDSNQMSAFIENAMREQSEMALQIFENIHGISRQVEAVSLSTFDLEENGRTILDAMERVRLNSAEMSQHSREQMGESQRILLASKAVEADVVKIVDHMHVVNDTSNDIAGIVEALNQGAANLGTKVSGLGSLVREFEGQTTEVLEEIKKFSV